MKIKPKSGPPKMPALMVISMGPKPKGDGDEKPMPMEKPVEKGAEDDKPSRISPEEAHFISRERLCGNCRYFNGGDCMKVDVEPDAEDLGCDLFDEDGEPEEEEEEEEEAEEEEEE